MQRLTLTGHQAPPKATVTLPCTPEQGRENLSESSWVKISTEGDPPPNTITGKANPTSALTGACRNSSWNRLHGRNSQQIPTEASPVSSSPPNLAMQSQSSRETSTRDRGLVLYSSPKPHSSEDLLLFYYSSLSPEIFLTASSLTYFKITISLHATSMKT